MTRPLPEQVYDAMRRVIDALESAYPDARFFIDSGAVTHPRFADTWTKNQWHAYRSAMNLLAGMALVDDVVDLEEGTAIVCACFRDEATRLLEAFMEARADGDGQGI